jgi:hypothetical protein
MKVIEQFYDVQTGEAGRREVEIPGVLTEDEARAVAARQAENEAKAGRLVELRERLLEALLTGEAVSNEERAEYARLKGEVAR